MIRDQVGNSSIRLMAVVTLAVMGLVFLPILFPGSGTVLADADYTRNAVLLDKDGGTMPGVYTVKASVGDKLDTATMGIPSVARQTLADRPTTETPAIITAAAVGYEEKTGPVEFKKLKERIAPYSYFRYGIIDEPGTNGDTGTHRKLSGFDGSYYIVRVDVSEIIAGRGENEFLHVKQEGNKALMVAYGMETGTDPLFGTYSDATGSKVGSYSLKDSAKALKDTDGNYRTTPYFDVILMSSGKLAAGADKGKEGVPDGDIKLSFYVDDKLQYNDLEVLDANNMPTFPYEAVVDKASDTKKTFQTETDYKAELLKKFYDDTAASEAGANAASYTVKGSDLEIDVMVDETEATANDGVPEFWSLTSAMGYQRYNAHTIRLICEVPVLEALSIESTTAEQRQVILDVNSFDIQIANNTTGEKPGLTISNNAQLLIKDGTNTSGAELAVGNNASMVIRKGGILTIDESCTNEVEYDAPTTTDQNAVDKTLLNGVMTIEDGGRLINRGVVNIEGTEGKPQDPNTTAADGTANVSYYDKKSASILVEYGGTFDNYGCLSLKGEMYVLGTLNNYGMYDDTIGTYDPDKGTTAYHRGIQITWKDVVTDTGVVPGTLNIGIDADKKIEKRAVLNNYGDIVVVPGTINMHGTLNNLKKGDATGRLYLCEVKEAVVPVVPDPNGDSTITEKTVKLDSPKKSVFNNQGTLNNKEGIVGVATAEWLHNGVLGKLTPINEFTDDSYIGFPNKGYTGTFTGKAHGITVKAPSGATITYGTAANKCTQATSPTYKDAGTHTVYYRITMDMLPDVVGSRTVVIKPASISKAKVVLAKSKYTYNGKIQKAAVKSATLGKVKLKSGKDFKLKYAPASPKGVGTYKVTVSGTGNYKGSAKAVSYQIVQASNPLQAKGKTVKAKAKSLKKKSVSFQRRQTLQVSKAQGKLTYRKVSVSKKKYNDKFAVKIKSGKIVVKKGVKKGTYKVKVKVEAAGTKNYKAGSRIVTVNVVVK